MKYLLLMIFFIYCSAGYAQWISQTSGTNQNLYDIEFLNENTGWAVGDAGVVIKTTNGGINWINVPNPSINAGGILVSVEPIDSSIVYVVGGHNVILKTTNGGQSWIEIRNGPFGAGYGFTGISYLNKDTLWFCGGNRVFRTFDGGNTLDSFYTPAFSTTDVYFKDIDIGLIGEEAEVYKTTNGGVNWFATNVPDGGAVIFFRKLAVAENQYAWVMGNNGTVFKTTNFGDTWALIDTIATGGFIPIHFSSAMTGWAGGTGNRLYKSTDGGFSWRREQTDTTSLAFIASIGFINDNIGWYVGGVGKVYKTTTSGQTIVSISENNVQLPDDFVLYQNYPNPFNNQTKISFNINKAGLYKFEVYTLLGERVLEVFNEEFHPGNYSVNVIADKLSSGVYIYRIKGNGIIKSKKFILVK